jgi:hypothetical protein
MLTFMGFYSLIQELFDLFLAVIHERVRESHARESVVVPTAYSVSHSKPTLCHEIRIFATIGVLTYLVNS